MAVAADGAAGAEVVAEEAAVVVLGQEVAAVGIAVAAVVGHLRCRDLAVAAADVQVEVTVVVRDPAEVAAVGGQGAEVALLVPVVGRCNDRKAIGRGSAACRRPIGLAAESVNGLVAAGLVHDLEQAALDRDRTLPVVAVVDQALAAVLVPVAVGRRKDNSTTSWISVAVVGGLRWVVGLRSPVELADKRLATLRMISCAIGQLAVSVRRRSPVPHDLE